MTALAIGGIIGTALSIYLWFLQNKGKSWKESKKDEIDKERRSIDEDIDSWSGRSK